MGMRNQNKSVAVVAQPSLLRMWNMKNRTREEGRGNRDAREIDDIQEPPDTNANVASTARSLVVNESVSVPTETRTSEVQSGTAHLASVSEPGVNRNQDELLNCSISDTDSADCHTTNGSINEAPSRPQLTKHRPRAKTERKANANSGLKPFPIFERGEAQRANAFTAEATSSSAKTELPEQKQSAGKALTRQKRSRKDVRTAGELAITPASHTVDNGSASDLSHLKPLRLEDVMEYTQDNKMPGPSSQPIASGSQEEPIVIDSSPVRESTEYIILESSPSPTNAHPTVRSDPCHDFFAPRKQNPCFSSAKLRRKFGEGDRAKWPGMDSQHVRGVQHSFPKLSLGSVGLHPKSLKEDLSNPLAPSDGYLHVDDGSRPDYEPTYLIEAIDSHPDGHAKCRDVLRSKASCAAISRFLDDNRGSSGLSWNERWRPRCASEVIGNEASATYLRDWLLALEIKVDGQSGTQQTEAPQGSFSSSATKTSRGTKRNQIIRTVDKPRKRRKRVDSDEESLSDWITSDDDEDTALPFTCFETEDELSDHSGQGSPWKPKLTRLSRGRPPDRDDSGAQANYNASSTSSAVHDFSDRLTNTILLAGPAGSGKTAAVYACAEELGWEVFEVYPGIGKRNGTSLLSLVGDVGKNHIVNHTSRGVANTHEHGASDSNVTSHSSATSKDDKIKAAGRSFAAFFSHGRKRPTGSGAGGSDSISSERVTVTSDYGEPPHTSELAGFQSSLDLSSANGGAPTSTELIDPRPTGARQSIILLEEVDILFGEDVNFWPTVITLIRESRRPVIMTCNDPNLVPSANLPLQTTLSFQPCPQELAISYLQCMALAEGYIVSEEHVKSSYERGRSLDVLDNCDDFLRSATYPSSSPDLRHAINSLQFACQGRTGCNDISLQTRSDIASLDVCSGSALDKARSWDWTQYFTSGFSPIQLKEADVQEKGLVGRANLWRLSDSLSMIDGYLARKSLDELQISSYASGAASDIELGYPCLYYEAEDSHLQDGIVLYNYDESIATEAVVCAGRAMGYNAAESGTDMIRGARADDGQWKLSSTDLLRHASGYFARVSCVLEKIVPAVLKQSVGALMLDYEPWVRSIDRSDMLLEAAALKESETRTGARGGRSTRNSQRMQYQRYFDLNEEERKVWHASGFAESAPDTLCGEDGSK